MIVQKLDRVFDRDDVIALGFVDAVDDRGERRAFTRTRRAGQQDNAVSDIADICELRRHIQRFETRDLVRDDTHHDRERISLLKDIYPESAFPGQGVAEIGRMGFGEWAAASAIVAKYRHRDHLGLKCGQSAESKRRRRDRTCR